MKSWYPILVLCIGVIFTEFCLSIGGCPGTHKIGRDLRELRLRDGSNTEVGEPGSSEFQFNGYLSDYEPIDVEAHTTEDPNSCMENATVQCDCLYAFREINGSCNNLDHPNWGVSNECYLRLQPAFYQGFESVRKSVKGGRLPEPRALTLNIFKHVHQPTKNVSFMFTIFGQTVAHDVSLALQEDPPGLCCAPENRKAPACMPIPVPSYDPFYSKFNVTCLEMNRTVACTTCSNSNRQQTNGATAALDASIVYGADDEKAKQIRANDGTGKLKSNNTERGELLPTGKDPFDIFCYRKIQPKCFLAGDVRVNQHTTLSSLQTLYMREHNRIASELTILNPHWGEERLYQEARRINIAEFQCITYKEYLPYLLGPSIMERYDLSLKSGSKGTKYNPEVRLGVWNEFATAVFRLHSMVATKVGALSLKFKNLYSNPDLIRQGHMGQILQGVCRVPSEKYDHWYVPDTTDFLYQASEVPYGNDLSSTDIQRGRDHGLAPYVHLVKYCFGNNANINSFEDLSPSLMSHKNVNLLKKNYKSVEDVDLWVGIQMEHHLPGSEVGPTAACIIARQLYATKFGDRFYFEHEDEVGSFTSDQRESLKQCSLSRMLCDNAGIKKIQKNTMLLPSAENPKLTCDDIPKIDLTLWTESSSI